MKRFPFALLIAVAALIAGCTSAGDAAPPGPNSPIASPDSQTGELAPFAGTVWVIGDSITVGARDHLSSAYPEAVINAETGRRFDQGIRELTTMLEQADGPDVLVYALGTNNGATPEQIEQVVDLAAGIDRIVFVNVAVPRGWETDTNAALDQVVGNLGNVAIVDWHTTVGDDSSLLRSDGYHPNADGAAVWADLIIRAIAG